jgi:hypothetical protein
MLTYVGQEAIDAEADELLAFLERNSISSQHSRMR